MVEKRKLNVICLSGHIGTGKSMIADYISMNYDFPKPVAFADTLKELLCSFGWNGVKDKKGRQLLQDVGQAVRNYDKDFWIKGLIEKTIGPHYRFAHINNFIISDLRFKNEMDKLEYYLRDSDMIINDPEIRIIKIRIEGKNYSSRLDSDDISEHDLDDCLLKFDHVINNLDKTKEQMYNNIDVIMNGYCFEKIKQPSIREELWMENDNATAR